MASSCLVGTVNDQRGGRWLITIQFSLWAWSVCGFILMNVGHYTSMLFREKRLSPSNPLKWATCSVFFYLYWNELEFKSWGRAPVSCSFFLLFPIKFKSCLFVRCKVNSTMKAQNEKNRFDHCMIWPFCWDFHSWKDWLGSYSFLFSICDDLSHNGMMNFKLIGGQQQWRL